MLHYVDAWIIDKFERFSHWNQRWFGLDSGTWERWCLLLSSVFILCRTMPRMSSWLVRSVYVWVVLIHLIRFIASFHRRRMRSSESLAMNPLKADPWMRLYGLIISVLCLIQDLPNKDLWFQFNNLAYYFAACDDLPWAKSKLKRAMDSLKTGVRHLEPVRVRQRLDPDVRGLSL